MVFFNCLTADFEADFAADFPVVFEVGSTAGSGCFRGRPRFLLDGLTAGAVRTGLAGGEDNTDPDGDGTRGGAYSE